MFLETKDWCQLLIWIFLMARGSAVSRPVEWEGTIAWSTPRKEKVRILPFQFSVTLGIKARPLLVSVTQMRLSEGGKPIACLCDHYAKQSCPAWRDTACTVGKSYRKVWLSSSDLVEVDYILELNAAHANSECHLHCNPHFSRDHEKQNDQGLSHGHFPPPR